jgi:uncharacterized OB-fold protein
MQYSFEEHRIVGGNGADDEYWRGLERGVFQLPRCAGCRRWTWPAQFRCGQCGSWEFEWVPLEPNGIIFSWTRSFYAFDRVVERRADLPYVTVVTELPGADGARVIGVLKGDETGLRIGTAVRGTIDPPCEKSKWYPSIRWEIVRAEPG